MVRWPSELARSGLELGFDSEQAKGLPAEFNLAMQTGPQEMDASVIFETADSLG